MVGTVRTSGIRLRFDFFGTRGPFGERSWGRE